MIQANYIDGRRRAPHGGSTFEKLNPADTRDGIGKFPALNAAEVQQAVDAARLALPAWRGRGGKAVFSGDISTSQMKRKAEDLGRWLFRELQFPAGAFLFTGTGIVPPNDFTLNECDVVTIAIDGIGTLENTVAYHI